jgi:putative (di)nucleoside polyphosphate hydrolase
VPRGSQYFRANVGAVICARGCVLALERSDVPDAWQMPQGGLKPGEEPAQAVLREVEEETGLPRTSLEPIRSFPELLAYELPPKLRSKKTGRGQVQYWFFFRLNKGVAEPRLPPGGEFRDWKWMKFTDLVKRAVDFRRPVYARLAEYFEREFRGRASE